MAMMTVRLTIIMTCLFALWLQPLQAAAGERKVAVVMPEAQQERWERTAQWALAGIDAAQTGLDRQVRLAIEWHDEDAADLQTWLQQVAKDESYAAVIGPTTSTAARTAASTLNASKKTLILPIATSTELQRIYAASPNVFNLTESDFTQCYLMMAGFLLDGKQKVSLLTSNDVYGQSFIDWFGYSAEELGLTVGMLGVYRNEAELRDYIRQWDGGTLLFAPGTEDDAVIFDQMVTQTDSVYCSDMMMSASLIGRLSHTYRGLAPCADPTSGFLDAYLQRFGEEPVNGEAHLYDALCLTAYAAALSEMTGLGMNDAITTVLDGRDTCIASWNDMTDVFSQLRAGAEPDISGATGSLDFDCRHHAAVLYSFYQKWHFENGVYTTEGTYSRNRDDNDEALLQLWDNIRGSQQKLNEQQEDFDYPEHRQNWALVIGTSDTWNNYRHQADALAMYQVLKRHNYDDDHIILIIEDNLADDPHNLYPGVVHVRPDGENVREGAVVDYHLSDFPMGRLKDILMGQQSERYPEVIRSNNNDNIFIYWCGHANGSVAAWGSNETVEAERVRQCLEAAAEAGKFRKMLIAVDACYSGAIGEACEGIPGVLFMTSASPDETSKADVLDPDMLIWLSNGFTRAFQETIDEQPDLRLRDLYLAVSRQTTGSHAKVYNEAHYGNLFHNTIGEFFDFSPSGGINTVMTDKADDLRWYSLSGMSWSNRPSSPGIYIHQGRKQIIWK